MGRLRLRLRPAKAGHRHRFTEEVRRVRARTRGEYDVTRRCSVSGCAEEKVFSETE
jgi:hypothetical protein